jgi:Flp pilus assembly protein TadG
MRRLARKEDGAAAIEFGLVALPFLALVFAIIETAFVFFAGQTLETAVADSARLILTGQAQAKGLNQTTFKEAVCAKVYGLFDCDKGVRIDVATFPSFSEINLSNPVDADGNFLNNQVYQPGGQGDIVVVRLFYQWPLYVSFIEGRKKQLLVAAAAFRNEPFGVPTPPPGN